MKLRSLLLFLILGCLTFNSQLNCMFTMPELQQWLLEGAKELNRISREEAIHARYARERKAQDLQNQLHNGNAAEQEVAKAQILGAMQNEQTWNNLTAKGTDALLGTFNSALRQHFEQEKLKQEQEGKEKIAKIEANAKAATSITNFRTALDKLTDPKKMLQIGGITLGVVGGSIILYYGTKLAYEQAGVWLNKPALVRETSVKSFATKSKDFILRKQEDPHQTLNDIILPKTLAPTLLTLAEDTKNTHISQLPFRNLLLYGPPGTGKTMFAKILAHCSGMDYAIMSGADFAQFKPGEDITQFYKLMQWAKQSKNGLIIFIDEADVFLRSRNKLSEHGIKILNAFLTQTGEESNKYMFIFATNHREVLDKAVLSRIHKEVYFPLPDQEERDMMLNLYMNKCIKNDHRVIKRGDTDLEVRIKLSDDITTDFIQSVAKQIDGFSGRDIMQLMSEIRFAAYSSPNLTLTTEIFDVAIKAKIEKHKLDTVVLAEGEYSGKILTNTDIQKALAASPIATSAA